MAAKMFSIFTCILLLILPYLCEAHTFDSNGDKSKPFEFLQHLRGCHKGDTKKGLHELKKYLKNFGYLDHYHPINPIQTDEDDDTFDDILESALKTYQLNYNLKATGSLDSETVNKMMMPRCGTPDIVNGTTSMRSSKKKHHHHHGSTTLHTNSHFSFFPGFQRWPAYKTHLTYAFPLGTQRDILSAPCARAFEQWSSVTHFTFEETQDYEGADISISVRTGAHGDCQAFDGPGGTLAHAYAPTDGRFHYDGDEKWADGPVEGYTDLETVALHEIGHLLGLAHSSVEGAIMYPSIRSGIRKGLHGDDVLGIRVLYDLW